MPLTWETEAHQLTLMTSPAERDQAQAALSRFPDGVVRLVSANDAGVELGPDLNAVVRQVINAVATGASVTVMPLPPELTTTEAARLLGVTRPTVMRLIRDGELEARLVGTHHRLAAEAVLDLRKARLATQRRALEELMALEDQLEQF